MCRVVGVGGRKSGAWWLPAGVYMPFKALFLVSAYYKIRAWHYFSMYLLNASCIHSTLSGFILFLFSGKNLYNNEHVAIKLVSIRAV